MSSNSAHVKALKLNSGGKNNLRFLSNLAAALAALFLTVASAHAVDDKRGSYVPTDTPPASAQQVTVGFYPISVYQLDMASNTYYVDTYVWLRWNGDIDPTGTIEFTNMVEEWGKQQENLLSEPKVLPDGSKYQIMRVEGRFVQPFSLADYPLDKQKLSIMVEDTTNGADALSYVIDKDSSGIGDSLQIPGWKLAGWTSQIFNHEYGTKFGEDATPSAYSAAQFSVNISRPLSFFFWKLLLPLFIVLGAALSALLIRPQDLDVRSALPAGALLTAPTTAKMLTAAPMTVITIGRASQRASSCTVLRLRLSCRSAITIAPIALCKTLAGTVRSCVVGPLIPRASM